MNNHSNFWVIKTILWLVLIISILLLIVLPLVGSLLLGYGDVPDSYLRYIRTVQLWQSYMLRVLTGAWFFFLGGCFASFLNVVAWRIPRGKSILGSSHCPNCNTRLSFRDNIPVLGWLKNGGACRHCDSPIAPRYFLVEVLLGSIFLLLAMVCLYTGGINLPLRPPMNKAGFEGMLLNPNVELIQIFAHHLTLICFLFTFALVRFDRLSIPISIFGVGVAFGIVFVLLSPAVQIVSWLNPSSVPAGYQTFSTGQPLSVLLGAVTGTFCGAATSTAPQSRRAAVLSLCLTGIFLGWQAVLSVSAIALIFHLATSVSPISPSPNAWTWPTKVLAGVLVHLVFWNPLSLLGGYWICHSSNAVQIGIFIAGLVVLAVLGNVLCRPTTTETQFAE